MNAEVIFQYKIVFISIFLLNYKFDQKSYNYQELLMFYDYLGHLMDNMLWAHMQWTVEDRQLKSLKEMVGDVIKILLDTVKQSHVW